MYYKVITNKIITALTFGSFSYTTISAIDFGINTYKDSNKYLKLYRENKLESNYKEIIKSEKDAIMRGACHNLVEKSICAVFWPLHLAFEIAIRIHK